MELKPRSRTAFRRHLLAWYAANRRALPWRRSRDPYKIWLAEVMLQQTRVAAVLPYYERFLARFPTVGSLARARPAEVLKFWSGLGYYARARNLHQAAREIVALHTGKFPRKPAAAEALPGVGRYTAAAVLSIAYGAPLAVLDGNVARVLARLGAVAGDLRQPSRWRRLENDAQRLLVPNRPGDWNQAMMELGESVCTPKSPRCPACPISRWCQARIRGLAGQIPEPRKKRTAVQVRIAATVLLDPERRTLLVRQPDAPEGALFSRMWQFPAVEFATAPRRRLTRHLANHFGIRTSVLAPLPRARHGVTFRKVTLLPFLTRVRRLPRRTGALMVSLAQVWRLPISSATRKIALAAQESLPTARGCLQSCHPLRLERKKAVLVTATRRYARAQEA